MPMYKVGDRVIVTTTEREGTIRAVYELGFWSLTDDEYMVALDGGTATVTLSGRLLKRIGDETSITEPICTCGSKFTSFKQIHSDWCELYSKQV